MRTPQRRSGKPNQLPTDPFITTAKFRELEVKLEYLKKVDRPAAISEVKRLSELGDFSENVEYQLAKGRLRGINNAIEKIENQIRRAEIIKPPGRCGTIQLGNTVIIESNGKQTTFQILGSTETNPQQGIISHNSPLGAVLLGRAIGEVVVLKVRNKEVIYRIIKIE